jgi:hypothetical protein
MPIKRDKMMCTMEKVAKVVEDVKKDKETNLDSIFFVWSSIYSFIKLELVGCRIFFESTLLP